LLLRAEADVRAEAVRSLGKLPGNIARAAASELLTDGEAPVRKAAVETCIVLRMESLHDRMAEMLKDEATDVRSAAAFYFQVFPVRAFASIIAKAQQIEKDDGVCELLRRAADAIDSARNSCDNPAP
jgi:HEAT repeat protein